MGEAPVFSCLAHVFTIDPRTKKTWLPASGQAITVSFFFDKSRETYRILSIDEAAQDPARKMTINSIVTERMSFKKTSQKFGQWADTASNTVYGLGFANEAELGRFVEQFCQALDHTRRLRKQQQQQQQQQQRDAADHAASYQAAAGGEPVDLDHVTGEAWRADREKLASQLQLMSLSIQKLEAENAALRSSRAADSDSRVLQLEKENVALKSRAKQLEDTAAQQQQQLKDLPAVGAELQRRLQEAAELCSQLCRQQQLQQPHRF